MFQSIGALAIGHNFAGTIAFNWLKTVPLVSLFKMLCWRHISRLQGFSKMPRGPRLTEEEKGRVLAHHRDGRSNRWIARELKRSEHAVRNVLTCRTATKPSKKVGRKAKCTKRIARRVFRLATVKKFSSKRVSVELGGVLRPSTIRKLLNSSKLAKWIKRKPSPAIKPHHKVARAAFAAKFLSKTRIWRRIVFSDEKKN